MNDEFLAVGAPAASDVVFAGGATYVFKRNLGEWKPAAKLLPVSPAPTNNFGQALAIVNGSLIVGSCNDPFAGAYSGVTYVYDLSVSPPVIQQSLSPNDAAAWDLFGCAVAAAGERLCVGALVKASAGSNALGAAYVFGRQAGVWVEEAKLVATPPISGVQFGRTVALSGGDVAVIGSQGQAAAGAAFVFRRSASGTWHQEQILIPSDSQPGDGFSDAVSIDGDSILLGAHNADPVGYSSGAAYVFERIGGVWTQTAKLFAPDGQSWALFGSGCYLRDGVAYVSGGSAGKVYRWKRVGSTWLFDGALESPNPAIPCLGFALTGHANVLAISSLCGIGEVHTFVTTSPQGARLEANSSEWSLQPGASVDLQLTTCASQVGSAYILLGSMTGVDPGMALGHQVLPLGWDAYSSYCLANPNHTPLLHTLGVISANQTARMQLVTPPNVSSALLGANLIHAAVVLNGASGALEVTASNSVALTIAP